MEIASCLIVKNARDHIKELIFQLSIFSDEIIIVDTGSDDGTYHLLKELESDMANKLKVHQFEWIDDFGAARNYSFSKVETSDWIFWCDADDSLNMDLIYTIITLKADVPNTDCSAVIFNYEFGPGYMVPRNRLLRRSANPVWHDRVHEYVSWDKGNSLDLSNPSNGYLIHNHRDGAHTDRNLRIYRKMISDGVEMSTRNLLYYANELCDNKEYGEAYPIYDSVLNDLCTFDSWNALLRMQKISRELGTLDNWIKRVEDVDKKLGLRADVCYWVGVYFMEKGDKHLTKKWMNRALGTNVKGLDKYGEEYYFAKYLPAKTLKGMLDEDYSRESDILNKYINVIDKQDAT